MPEEPDAAVRITALVCLTVVVVAAIVGMTVVAVMTDRDLWKAEVLTFLVVLILATLGGWSYLATFRRHRWRLERTDEGPGIG